MHRFLLLKQTGCLVLILFFIFQSFSSNAQSDSNKNKETQKSKKKNQKKLNEISLSALQKSYTAQIGTKITYTCEVHNSVGIKVDFSLENEEVLTHLDTKMVYDHPEKMKKNMSGADAASKTFTFEAIASGKGIITMYEYYRGKLKHSYEFEITVEE